MYMCILENSLPDGIVLGVSDSFRGGCEMIHDHLCHFFLSEEVVREAWIWTWGLRSLEKKCEEEKVGGVDIHMYIRPCFPFFLFYSSSLWVEKQSINRNQVQQTSKRRDIHIFIMKLSILAAWLSAVGTAQAFWVRPFYFTLS